MRKTITVRTTATRSGNNSVRVRTSVSNGHTTRTTTKTVRVK